MKRDYHRLLYAADGLAARAVYDTFVKRWSALCPAVAKSLEEAGLELLTFYDFPKAMWKSLRTTHTVENLNREFRRRTEDASLVRHRGRRVDRAVWARRVRSHPAAKDRWPSAAAVLPREGMAGSRVRRVEWVNRSASGYAVQAISTRLGPHPTSLARKPNLTAGPVQRQSDGALFWKFQAATRGRACQVSVSCGRRNAGSWCSTCARSPSPHHPLASAEWFRSCVHRESDAAPPTSTAGRARRKPLSLSWPLTAAHGMVPHELSTP